MVTAAALSLLLPTAEETDLLRACLWSGEPARAAWTRWQQVVGDARRALAAETHAAKSLLAPVHDAMRRNALVVDAPLRAVLSAAALAEELRSETYRRVLLRALDALADASVRVLVMKGAALAYDVYPAPALRHSHDVDLLVGRADLTRAARALVLAGFTPSPPPFPRGDHRRLVDRSGLPVEIHCGLVRLPFYTSPLAAIWERARRCTIAGHGAETLSAADQLVQICGQASCCASRKSLRWVTDAWHLITRDGTLDWDVVERTARASRLALPLAVLFAYLAEHLEAPVPGHVRESLSAAAAQADRATREIALVGVRAGARGTFRNLFRTARDWHERAALIKWMLAPAPATLRLGEPLRHAKFWPAYYALRPIGYVVRRVRSAIGTAPLSAGVGVPSRRTAGRES
jgi:hypothetical protein